MPLSPAQYVINKIGGVRKTARIVGRAAPSVSKWTKPRKKKGTGGGVPRGTHKKILAYAKRAKLDITAHDLVFGR